MRSLQTTRIDLIYIFMALIGGVSSSTLEKFLEFIGYVFCFVISLFYPLPSVQLVSATRNHG